MTKTAKLIRTLVECSLMIAFATVLSLIKLAEMPYGGSITLASMLPMIIISYRHGLGWGAGAGAVYAAIQQLLGLNDLSYVTGWQSVLAVIMLDYILAFMTVALGGIFRRRLGKEGQARALVQSRELALGALTVCLLRYILHTVAGATVWAGLSIPTEAALLYSIGYNATYMIPETIVNVLVAMYLGSILDFTKQLPVRFPAAEAAHGMLVRGFARFSPYIAYALIGGGIITDAVLIFPHLQDAKSGEFTFAYLSEVSWPAVIIISAICLIAAIAILLLGRVLRKRAEGKEE